MGAAPAGLALVSDGVNAALASADRSLLATAARPIFEFEPARALQSFAPVLRGIELLLLEQQPDMLLTGFTLGARADGATIEELQRTLRSPAFFSQLDQLRGNAEEQLNLDRSVTISVAGVSLGLSLVYVLWLIRGGVLMGSYLSALPAWRVLDPLPVLSRVDEETQEDDEALDAVAQSSGNPLRGFG